MLAILLTVLFALVGSLTHTLTWAASETKDIREYGNCAVATMVDLLTDAESPILLCRGENSTQISVTRHHRTGLTTVFKAGLQFHAADFISVIIRFPPHPLIRRQAKWTGENALILDPEFTKSLLPRLTTETRLVVKVGTESGVIDLTGAVQAV